MDKSAFLYFLASGIFMILCFHGLWTDPKKFLQKTKSYRIAFYNGWLGNYFKRLYGEEDFVDPKLEILLGRIGFLIIFFGILLTLYSIVTNPSYP
jgi:hypothetical protein